MITDRAERTTHRSTTPSYRPPSGPGLVVPIVNSGNERYGLILWNRRTGCSTSCSLVVLPLGVWSGGGDETVRPYPLRGSVRSTGGEAQRRRVRESPLGLTVELGARGTHLEAAKSMLMMTCQGRDKLNPGTSLLPPYRLLLVPTIRGTSHCRERARSGEGTTYLMPRKLRGPSL